MKKKYFVIGIVAVLAGLALWYSLRSSIEQAPHGSVHVTLGDGSVDADISDSETRREQGLSGRASLSDTQGMLFVFDSPGYYAFWMKDMLFPIDMIWLDADKKTVFIKADASPASYPESFTPSTASLYVLEVPAGWARRHRVEVGSVANFEMTGAGR